MLKGGLWESKSTRLRRRPLEDRYDGAAGLRRSCFPLLVRIVLPSSPAVASNVGTVGRKPVRVEIF
jgi:hypothetical protein